MEIALTILTAAFVLGFSLYLVLRILRQNRRIKNLNEQIQKYHLALDPWRFYKFATKKRVLKRAGYQCEWVSPEGERCPEVKELSIDHIQPWSAGGWTIEDNAQVLCHFHNILKGGLEPTKAQIREIEKNRKAYFAPGESVKVRWKPNEAEQKMRFKKSITN